MIQPPGLYPDIDHATYHRRILGVASNTALGEMARSPAHYRAWVDGYDKETPALRFGNLVDRYVLDHARFVDRVAIMPDFGNCRFKDNREWKKSWEAENADKEMLEQAEWDEIRRIGDAIQGHRIARALLQGAQTQVSLFWEDAETGIHCKSRLDILTPRPIIADLKTAFDASEPGFAKAVVNCRYHAQAAMYLDGLEALGKTPRGFVFIVAEKEPPYPVVTYQLDGQAIDRGRELYRRDLDRLKQCIETDEWPAYGTSTMSLSLPAWALKGD